ncbi:MAG: MBOAT family protein [Bacteroidales bacterium]|jgi:D-alanyl-lipoteichoic acid acyltransferase DltB (MBOAT superfamily)|nr:MBOAT family protein [Bacteroidales bacterium]
MFFNSIDFIIFLPVVFFLYWFLANNIKLQNIFIVIASYVFYGWWDWRFLFLILFSTFVDYLVGISLLKEENIRKRKILLCISVFVNLLFLGFFKYCNFFIDNFVRAFAFFGMKLNIQHLSIVLPVGISFYTFQTMSYSIDVYKNKLEPTKDFIAFVAFVSFFPQLVAGPIERAAHLLPQFYTRREFNYDNAVNGCKQILWGFFKKVVIADNCAIYANIIFNNFNDYSGIALIVGAVFFAFQIYGDFSGYSDIAVGVSRLFGINLMQNFAFPYFSRSMAEFWRRWHISLTAWFRDYVYIPLGGSRRSMAVGIRNTFVIFILSGFWHGAKWTFITWGFLNALYFLPLLLMNKNRNYRDTVASGRVFPGVQEIFSMTVTFGLTVFAWIFFRSENTGYALQYISRIFTPPFVAPFPAGKRIFLVFIILLLFLIIEWNGREKSYAIEKIPFHGFMRWMCYYGILGCIILFGGTPQTFIYFQF